MTYSLSVARFDPDRPGAGLRSEYEVAMRPEQTVYDALLKAREEIDPSLAFRGSCRSGICGGCAVAVNGRPQLCCQVALASAAAAGGPIRVDPLPNFPVLKDLVVDFDPFFDALQAALPWLVARPDYDGVQPPDVHQRLEGPAACILCGICEAELPRGSGQAAGPMGWVKAFRFAHDNRDALGQARLALFADLGLVSADAVRRLAQVCPKNILLDLGRPLSGADIARLPGAE